jgi:hypothetical protein
MIKCTICENHERDGAKHTCRKCKTKIIYGEIQEQFIEGCSYFKMNEAEKKRQAYYKKINSLPIDDRDRGCGGKKK